jgi:hypothetical protein
MKISELKRNDEFKVEMILGGNVKLVITYVKGALKKGNKHQVFLIKTMLFQGSVLLSVNRFSNQQELFYEDSEV